MLLGGISFFSPRKGLVCDNVRNYEVILANGTTVNANVRQNTDLRRAVRGGSNNFGIVTRFDLETFPQGELWGGDIAYPISTAPQQLKAFADFGAYKDYDPFAALFQIFVCVTGGICLTSNNPIYTKPQANPPVFRPFTSIKPQNSNTCHFGTLKNFMTIPSSELASGQR